jgi:hypothetical protein
VARTPGRRPHQVRIQQRNHARTAVLSICKASFDEASPYVSMGNGHDIIQRYPQRPYLWGGPASDFAIKICWFWHHQAGAIRGYQLLVLFGFCAGALVGMTGMEAVP